MERGRPGETYIIAGPRHTFEYAFDLGGVARQGPRADVSPGPHAMRAMAAATSAVGHFVTLPPAFTPEALRVLAGTTYFGSNEKAVRELGYSPRPLEEGMAQTLEHELRLLGRA